MKKKLLVLTTVLVLVVSAFALTGCGGSSDSGDASDDTSWTYVEDKGELVVGLDDTFAPMGFRDEDGNLVGFDIDLATAVGEELGVSVKFQPINWDSKYMELESKNIDCIWNGMSITSETQKKLTLSNKYLNNKIIIMTLKDDVKVEKAEDLANYNIATQVDSSALNMLTKNEAYDSYKDNISEYKTYDQAIMDMQTGRMDCMVVDQVLGEYKNSQMEEKMTVCDFDFGDDFYAVGFRKGEEALASKVNDAIKATIDNGKAEEISNKWFGKNIVIFEPIDEE